jgi:hypothetical protein
MKRLILAAVALGAPLAFAQMQYQTPPPERKIEAPTSAPRDTSVSAVAKPTVETPKPKCEDPGAYPGRVGMQTEDRRNRFIKSVETYRNCMVAFVEERRAVVEANQSAAKQAVEDLNARIKKINDEQTAAQN